jgi:isopentenyl diphosphate isomerase/L-lactate dehydrogenase-like FMN-dependent dehydrogenase
MDLLKSEVDRVMALLGCTTVDALGPQYLRFDSGEAGEQTSSLASQRQAI